MVSMGGREPYTELDLTGNLLCSSARRSSEALCCRSAHAQRGVKRSIRGEHQHQHCTIAMKLVVVAGLGRGGVVQLVVQRVGHPLLSLCDHGLSAHIAHCTLQMQTLVAVTLK